MDKSLSYATTFANKHNIKTSKATMINDVNGFSWAYADAMYEHGIRYLYTSINTHHGRTPFSKPLKPFYWRTPKGERILVWSGLTYHKGNLLGIVPGWTLKGDAMVPGLEPTDGGFIEINSIMDFADERIHALVKAYRESDYEYDFIPICASGLYTDNSPLDDGHISLINEWNEKFGDDIMIEAVTLEELFDEIKRIDDIPEYAGDWNDFWSDGVLSTPDETRLFLNAKRNKDLIHLLDPNQEIISSDDNEKLLNALILYAEHTWGHSASWSDPYRLLVKQLDLRKASLAINADVISHQMLDQLYESLGEGEFRVKRPHEYVVVNPHDVSITSEIYLPTDFWEEGMFVNKQFIIVSEDGKHYVTQRKSTLRGSFFTAVISLEPKERKNFCLKAVDMSTLINHSQGVFIGQYYVIQYNHEGISSLKYLDQEILGEESMIRPIYQVFKNGSRQNAAGFGYSKRSVPNDEIFAADAIHLDILNQGDVFTTLRYTYNLEGTDHLYCDITLYQELPKIEISLLIGKSFTKDPEGLYAKISMNTDNAKWLLDKPNTLIEPGKQLDGTCFDYYTIQRGVILSRPDMSISFNLLDSPLITFDKIKLWEFNQSIENKGDLFVWITNNKWETNFRTETAGYLESRIVIDFSQNEKGALKKLNINQFPLISLRK